MKYKNPRYKKIRNTYALEVSCGTCKTPVAVYAKGGRGNLIKVQLPRIIESQVDLENNQGHLLCPSCKSELAKVGTYKSNITYWIVRGKANTKILNNYRI